MVPLLYGCPCEPLGYTYESAAICGWYQLGEEMLDTTEITLPAAMALPPVGGVVPRRGPLIPSSGERALLRSPYGPQPSRDRRFFTPSVYLPEEYGGYL